MSQRYHRQLIDGRPNLKSLPMYKGRRTPTKNLYVVVKGEDVGVQIELTAEQVVEDSTTNCRG